MSGAHRVDRKPDWLKTRINTNENFRAVRRLVADERLHTVCREASCPNIYECWGTYRTAAFMILGGICTRSCRFCDVQTGRPGAVDPREPLRVAHSVRSMELRHVFITMVNRDDLPDGGAGLVAETVRAVRRLKPECSIELLTSDMMGRRESIGTIVESKPAILGHNIETVQRLTPRIRSRSSYVRSIEFLSTAKTIDPACTTKSSIMLGLGETRDEILRAMDDLRAHQVDILNIGQYLRPSRANLPVLRYWTPEEFADLKREAMIRGFSHCEAGPRVRSSYHASDQFDAVRKEQI